MRKFIEKEFPNEKNIIYSILCIWCIFLIITFALSSTYEAPYEWLWKINPWTWGDSFWIINSFISVITLLLVYKTFWLQKKELDKTTDTLKLQEIAIKEQKFQDTFTLLLQTAQEHINWLIISAEEVKNDKIKPHYKQDIIDDLKEKYYFELRWSMVVRYLSDWDWYDKVLEYVKRGTLGNFRKYINTLWMLEECLRNADPDINKDFFIKLARTQINASEIELYNKLKDSTKKWEFIELTIFNKE